jgi:ankyrin repeat protein
MSYELHHLVKQGNFQHVREFLNAAGPEDAGLNDCDRRGYTPLMHAVESHKASVDLVRLLLDCGADVHQWSQAGSEGAPIFSALSLCLAGGDPQKIAALVGHGADLHYARGPGYNALIDAVHGLNTVRDPGLIDLLRLLIANGVPLNGVTSYGESALRSLSRIGRFDAVRLLLDAGADEAQLAWTPLIRAVALGSVSDVEDVVAGGVSLEERDWWERTAWLVAVQSGDLAKARLLLEHGADADACGRCGKTALIFAIENYHAPMLQWLLETGASMAQTDEYSRTPLMAAVESGNVEAIEALLKAGADVNALQQFRPYVGNLADRLLKAGIDVNSEERGTTALASAQTRDVAILLLDAGADPAQLSFEGRRALIGLEPEPDECLLDVSPEDFHNGRSRRFGTSNPEEIREPFWQGMIRSGVSAAHASYLNTGEAGRTGSPVWCAERFGQSITLLPDGRVVQIGGEHEDSYDWDFCIYNDVFVHDPDGTIHIFGYPETVFPPTDFHTATLIGEYIYIVGSLGYQGTREYGTTPVFRLSTKTLRIETAEIGGEAPGWISKHRAVQTAAHEIRVTGGKIAAWDGERETQARNERSFVLDIKRLVWRQDGGGDSAARKNGKANRNRSR